MVPDNQEDARPDRWNTRLFFIANMCAVFGAAFWCFFNFLTAEDSVVLFNRYNFLEDAPIYFFYAGYWSVFPQTIAFLVSEFNPAIQAVAYSLVALAVFMILLREIFKATHSGFLTVAVAVLATVFMPFMLFNLTYTFWPGLVILGLVGLRAGDQKKGLSFTDVLICIPGLTGSPLGFLFFPLFAYLVYRDRSAFTGLVFITAVASFFVLVEQDGKRSSIFDIIQNGMERLTLIIQSPLEYLINTTKIGALVMSTLGTFSVLLVIVVGVTWMVQRKPGVLHVMLYMACSLLSVFAAVGSAGLPLSGRYWLPIIICAVVLIGKFIMVPRYRTVRRLAEPVLAVVLCVGMLGSSALRVQSWGGPSLSVQEWSAMISSPDNVTSVRRVWHENFDWAIGAGQGSVSYDECVGIWEHPTVFESFGFRIYCGNGVFGARG